MYGSAVVAEEVCRLNRWDRCSLPINALETALELRQLDTVSFFLRSRESDPREPSESVTAPTPADIPTLPPIPLDQLDTAIAMLLVAIRKNHHDHHTSQYASRLLIMTLAFLTRMIKGQALFEERTGEEIAEEEEAEAEEEKKEERKRCRSCWLWRKMVNSSLSLWVSKRPSHLVFVLLCLVVCLTLLLSFFLPAHLS